MRTRITVFICLVVTVSYAQKKAVTEFGEEVLLHDNGKWEYLNKDVQLPTEIPINSMEFLKGKSSTFLLKSAKINVGVWLDPKKWNFTKEVENTAAEYELHLKSGDLYGMIIVEKIEIPVETLKNVAIKNGRSVAPDLKVIKEEYRTVNGLKVLFMQMNGSMQGIKFSYYGYYFSNGMGTVQFVTYTSQSLLSGYQSECEELLNGMVEIK